MLKFFSKNKKNKPSLKNTDDHHKASHFHTLKVSDIVRETEDCVSVGFAIPDDIRYDFEFIAGQNLTLRATINGEDVRRSYSLCSAPFEGVIRVAIKKVEDGVFSTWATETLKVGDDIQVMTPTGGFIANTKDENAHHYVGIAAGSGITPVISILKSVLFNEPKSSFTLFYGNKNVSSIIFKEELEDLRSTYLGRLEIHNILSREDQGMDYAYGRIDAEKVNYFAKNFIDVKDVHSFYICGPQEMTEISRDTLGGLGVDAGNIHFELFTAATPAKAKTEKKKASKDSVKSAVTVILDGDETHFDVATSGKNVLDAALDAGADVPFACKGAVCCTCRAKVMDGSAEMDMNYALTEEEVEEGYILTCQSHPTSEKLVVSYDE